MAEEVREQAGAGGRVAFLSTPTAFIALKVRPFTASGPERWE
jgi:hypothetical protein